MRVRGSAPCAQALAARCAATAQRADPGANRGKRDCRSVPRGHRLINHALLRDLQPLEPGARRRRFYDDRITGYYVEQSESGRVIHWLRYSDARGRRREYRIGRHGDITPEQARQRATEVRAEVVLGGSPTDERLARRGVPTFREFMKRRFLPHAGETIKSAPEYEAMARLRLIPALGRLRLDEIRPEHVAALRRSMVQEGLSNARVNRHLAVLRRALNLALDWELFSGRNPAKSPGMLREHHRELFLTSAQVGDLLAALDTEADRAGAGVISLLALTGGRKAEILRARWEDVDLGHSLLAVPVSKSGRRRHIVLSAAAAAVVRRQPSGTGPMFVFPSPRLADRPLQGVEKTWRRVKLGSGPIKVLASTR